MSKNYICMLLLLSFILISSLLQAEWFETGISVCMKEEVQWNPAICTDGENGAIIVWEDRSILRGIYAQKIDGNGNLLWPPDGELIKGNATAENPSNISDGVGGSIITWKQYTVFAQRVDSNGAIQWGNDGVELNPHSAPSGFPQIISDDNGGAIIVWYECRSDAEMAVRAQRINPEGVKLWSENGITVSDAPGRQWFPRIVRDGSGGAIIVWDDERSGYFDNHIFAQRIDADGNTLWGQNGIGICYSTVDHTYYIPAKIVSDDVGGAIIVWVDERPGNIYAQRINNSGICLWTSNGIAVCPGSNGHNPEIVEDGVGGAFICWVDNSGDLSIQRISDSGILQLPSTGISVCIGGGQKGYPKMLPNNEGGVIIAWPEYRFEIDLSIYIQRIDAFGNLLWDPSGILVCPAIAHGPGDPFDFLRMCDDQENGAIITYATFISNDYQYDIGAQRIDRNGMISRSNPDKYSITYPEHNESDPANRSGFIGNWVSVRITALDSENNIVAGCTSTISVDVCGNHNLAEIDWTLETGNGTLIDGGPGDDTATYTFNPADNGVVTLQIRDDHQDFLDPEVIDQADSTITDDDSEEYIVFTKPNNIPEDSGGIVPFGRALATYSTSTPTPNWLASILYWKGPGGYLTDPTITVIPYKDASLLGITPPPNFKMIYDGALFDSPYPYCNGYTFSCPSYPPSPKPFMFGIRQAYHDNVLAEVDEFNIQMLHWNGSDWVIVPATIYIDSNYVEIDTRLLSQLSPFMVAMPLEENIHSANISLEPDEITIKDNRGWVYSFIELPQGLDVHEIDVGTATLNPWHIDVLSDSATQLDVAVADTAYIVIGDCNANGIEDIALRFDRETVVSMFRDEHPAETFAVRGFMKDGYTFFKGTDTIEIVDEPLTVTLDLNPETLNLKSKGKWMTAYIEMPEYYMPSEIDRQSLCITSVSGADLAEPIYAENKPTAIGDYNGNGIPDLMVKFDRQAVQSVIDEPSDAVTIAVSGSLTDGTPFCGIDSIRSIKRGLLNFALTRMNVTITDPDRPGNGPRCSYRAAGITNLAESKTFDDLTLSTHIYVSVSSQLYAVESEIQLKPYYDDFVYAYAPNNTRDSCIDRFIFFDPSRWGQHQEHIDDLPVEGVIDLSRNHFDEESMKIIEFIENEMSAGSDLPYYFIVSGSFDLPSDYYVAHVDNSAQVVLELFTHDRGSLANIVQLEESDLRITNSESEQVWSFIGLKEGTDELEYIPTVDLFEKEVMQNKAIVKDNALALHQNHPNPFNPATTISFSVPEKVRVILSVYDIEGKLIKTLLNKLLDQGYQETCWDGTDMHGNPVTSGIYFYRLKAGKNMLTRKMVLLK